MDLVRRRLTLLPAAVAAVSFCMPFGAFIPGAAGQRRGDHFIPPFRKSPEFHHVFLSMQKSAPKVEARLSEWQALTKRQTEALRSDKSPVIERWRREYALIPLGQTRTVAQGVNRLVNNNVRYVSDWDHGGDRDKWYGPVDTIKEGGDCEDYSLLKGYLLYHKGWPIQGLHLVAGILLNGQAHMMLGIDFADGGYALLDNLTTDLHPRPFHAWTPKYQIGPDQQSLVFLKAT